MVSKSQSRVLTDHDQIRRWAEERGATPTAVRRTESDEDVGIIRLDFPNYSGAGSLDEISWDEWFDKFDEKNLALLVQDQMANGKASNFNKLVSRDTVEESEERGSRSRRTSARSSSSRQSKARKSTRNSRAASKKSSRSERSSARGAAKKKSASTRGSTRRRRAA